MHEEPPSRSPLNDNNPCSPSLPTHIKVSSHLLQKVPSAHNPSSANSIGREQIAPTLMAILPLPHRERHKIINQAPAENPIAPSAQTRKTQPSRNFGPQGRLRAHKVRHAGIVQEIQTPDPRESLRHDVRQYAAPAARVHGVELRVDVPQLHQAVDPDEDVGGLEGLAVPEEHPRADAEVAEGVVGDEADDFVELAFLGRVRGGVFPELVEPG